MKLLPPLPQFGIVLLAVLLSAAVTGQAQVVLDFTTSSQYTGNFRDTAGDASIGHNSSVPALRFNQTGSSTAGVTVYDTTPGDGAASVDPFLDTTIRVNFRVAQSGDSVGILTRIDSSNRAYMVVANIQTATGQPVLRLYESSSASTGGATSLLNTTNSVIGNPLAINTFYSLEFSTTNVGGNVQLTARLFNVNDFGGTALYSVTHTDSSVPILSASGQVGLRFGTSGGTATTDVTHFSIVPEPGTLALPCVAMLGLLIHRRRA